jgi:hypothetical protein
VASRNPQGVLVTGVYGSGKSSVAAEIGYELEQRGELYALLDLDFLGWVGDHDTGRATMLRNLAAIAPNYGDLGVGRYVLAYFVHDRGTLDAIKDALAVPLRVAAVRADHRDRTALVSRRDQRPERRPARCRRVDSGIGG